MFIVFCVLWLLIVNKACCKCFQHWSNFVRITNWIYFSLYFCVSAVFQCQCTCTLTVISWISLLLFKAVCYKYSDCVYFVCYFNQLKFWPQQIYSFESYNVTVLPLLPPSLLSASYPLFFCFHQIFDKKEKSKNEKEKVCMSAFLEAGANTLHLNRPVGCTLCTRVFFFFSLSPYSLLLFVCLFVFLFIHNLPLHS